MNKNVFKYLRKKILENSSITEEKDDIFHIYKIESLGFQIKVSFPAKIPSKKLATSLLIDKLVEIPEYLNKLEQIETRKDNLKSLLD
jgi:hypothetical protein